MILWALSLLLKLTTLESSHVDTTSLKHIANISYAVENLHSSGMGSIFSPRMDFDQWKPLTGRGDPLRNDPTYDYEPPVLERVHYWADETRFEREHIPERKSEVLMLGVSSRKPSVAPRQPPPPPRRHHRPPPPPKYEDYAYKVNEYYPMTILVPPPPPPPGHKPSLFVLTEEKLQPPNSHIKLTEPPKLITPKVKNTTTSDRVTSLYALQEANLIYQSSTTSQNWIKDLDQTKSSPNTVVSSDYAGWGPTTPIDGIDAANDSHNLISIDHIETSKHPYQFYKPMLSEAPPPPDVTTNPLLLPTFIPTVLPPLPVKAQSSTISITPATWPMERTTTEISTVNQDYNEETTTDKIDVKFFTSTPATILKPNSEKNLFDMLSPMLSMPLVNGPELQDNLYAYASENLHIYKGHETEDTTKLETMQTMQSPPLIKFTESTTISDKQPFLVNKNIYNSLLHKKPSLHTQDPYLHMRYTTPMPTVGPSDDYVENTKSTSEPPTIPMYLIIQGHSKVKTYGSKPKPKDDNDTINNEIPKPHETNEVKHLHPIKEKYIHKLENIDRRGKSRNLKSLVDEGHGSIEIQETDVGIKYDVSDGREVPIEIYRKGIVDNDENDYASSKKDIKQKRIKRQIDLEDLLPFDEDTLEEYVYNYLNGKRNETGITGILAKAVTSNVTAALDDLDDDDDDDDDDEDNEQNRENR